MNCDRFLPFLTTGGPFRRWRATRHAARCPQCAEAQARIQKVTAELATAPPLTAAQRALWTSASVTDEGSASVRPRASTLWIYVGASVVAAILVGVVAARSLWPRSDRRIRQPDIIAPSPSLNPQRNDSQILTALRADLDDLERDLADLRRQVDLIEIRKDADALWAQYGRRERVSSQADRPSTELLSTTSPGLFMP
jgi:hypothetical protein